MTTLTVILAPGPSGHRRGEILAQGPALPGGEPSRELLGAVRDAIVEAVRLHESGEPVASCEIRVTI